MVGKRNDFINLKALAGLTSVPSIHNEFKLGPLVDSKFIVAEVVGGNKELGPFYIFIIHLLCRNI